MTRTPRHNASLFRRLALGTVAAATTLTVALATPATASASKSTSSLDVASQANHALWLLVQWENTGTPASYSSYLRARSQTADAVGSELGVSAADLDAAWGQASIDNQHVLMSAMSQVGVPYRSRMSKANRGFDCSGLVLYAYAQAGIELPRSSGDQIRAAEQIHPFDADPGDLVYYPGHISLYLGADLIVHSPQSGKDVEIRSMFDRKLRFGDAIPDKPAP